MHISDRLQRLDLTWMLILAGDVNIDMIKQQTSDVKRYTEMPFGSLNRKQVVTKATRSTKSSQTLVDHVITNLPRRVTHTDVLPCTLVSDHDASYVFFLINIYPGASNLAGLVRWSPDTTHTKTKTLKLEN